MTSALETYVHRYLPPEGDDPRTLLLLHGTGGDENDLIQLGQMLGPDAGLLSPRGTVLENGARRFFRRLAEGVFDLDDLHRRTRDLIAFVDAAADRYGFDPTRLVAVGFSNGANIAGSVLLTSPDTLAEAVLFRPMVPFVPEEPLSLSDKRVFIGAGKSDPIATPETRMSTSAGISNPIARTRKPRAAGRSTADFRRRRHALVAAWRPCPDSRGRVSRVRLVGEESARRVVTGSRLA